MARRPPALGIFIFLFFPITVFLIARTRTRFHASGVSGGVCRAALQSTLFGAGGPALRDVLSTGALQEHYRATMGCRDADQQFAAHRAFLATGILR